MKFSVKWVYFFFFRKIPLNKNIEKLGNVNESPTLNVFFKGARTVF